jgi:MSHA biogenesis protein MshO
MRAPQPSSGGFTLIEMIVTIVVGSIVVAFMAMFIVIPMDAYSAQTRRAELVDDADSALRFMSRDIASALPNSVRVTSSGTVTAIELLSTLSAARYRDGGPLSDPTQDLDFTSADTEFATTAAFANLALPWTSSTAYLSIYNVGVPGANAYQMANVITPAGTTITIAAFSSSLGSYQNQVTMSPGFQFAYSSPGKRVYLVDGPVSYLCDTATNTLTRYSGYPIAYSQPVSAGTLSSAGATAALIAANVGACAFTLTPGTAQRDALATISLQITESGESVQILHEVQIANAP